MDEISLRAGGRKGGRAAGVVKADQDDAVCIASRDAERDEVAIAWACRLGNHRWTVYCTAPGTAGVPLSRASRA